MPKGEYLQYGGQAILEGVMMRSPRFFSVACRAPNGEIVISTEALEKTWIGRQKWLKWPFLRGTLAILDSMALGVKSMRFAAAVQTDPQYQVDVPPEKQMQFSSKRVQDVAIGATLLVSLVLGLFVFNYLPNSISEYSLRALHVKQNDRLYNIVAEAIKAVFFLGYVAAIGFVPDIAEVFKYHGAEHKAINTLEHDRPLTFEECKKQTRLHPRCGTSFAIIVLLLGFAVFTFVPRYPITHHQGKALVDITVRVGIEICILPLIAGVAYELLRLAGKFRNTTLVNILFQPGLLSQYLTTREPTESQIEVALTSLKACIEAEESGAVPEPKPEANALESAPTPVP